MRTLPVFAPVPSKPWTGIFDTAGIAPLTSARSVNLTFSSTLRRERSPLQRTLRNSASAFYVCLWNTFDFSAEGIDDCSPMHCQLFLLPWDGTGKVTTFRWAALDSGTVIEIPSGTVCETTFFVKESTSISFTACRPMPQSHQSKAADSVDNLWWPAFEIEQSLWSGDEWHINP